MTQRRHPRQYLTLLALLALPGTLGACRYSVFPLVPTPVQGEFPARLTQGSLSRQGDELVLPVRLNTQDKAGFLTVVWFRTDDEIARDQVYLDARDDDAVFRLTAPEKGYYRAVVSFEGNVLRQFELEEVPLIPPAPELPPAPADPAGR